MRTGWPVVLGAAALLLANSAARAHHSFAMFDTTREVTVTGQVTQFQWTNPHIWIQVESKGADGKPVLWSIEGGGPNILARKGMTKRTFKVGDTVTITMHPLKDGKPGGDFVKVVLADGKVVDASSAATVKTAAGGQ